MHEPAIRCGKISWSTYYCIGTIYIYVSWWFIRTMCFTWILPSLVACATLCSTPVPLLLPPWNTCSLVMIVVVPAVQLISSCIHVSIYNWCNGANELVQRWNNYVLTCRLATLGILTGTVCSVFYLLVQHYAANPYYCLVPAASLGAILPATLWCSSRVHTNTGTGTCISYLTNTINTIPTTIAMLLILTVQSKRVCIATHSSYLVRNNI